MPQPTTAPPADSPTEPAVPAILRPILAKPAGERSSAERQIMRAHELERERSSLMERIGANREYLRLMGKNDELTSAQTKWLNLFYPEKERGERRSAEEIEATRKARAAARS